MVMPLSKTETTPSIRYINVESITPETLTIPHPTDPAGGDINVSCIRVTFTFALYTVPTWGDACYYKVWIIKETPNLVCNWSIGFSANNPPGLQGIFIDESTDLITIHAEMADFPYMNETRQHVEDGRQEYYFYKIHFYFNNTIYKGEEVRFAADYESVPTLQGSELLRLVITDDDYGYEVFYREPDLAGPGQIDIKRR